MQKNVASQKITVFAFNVTTNLPVTGDSAQITANIRKDGGAANPTNDANPTELEDSYYDFNMLKEETNANKINLTPESSTADIIVISVPGVIYTRPANFQSLGIESGGELTKVNLCDANTDMRGTDAAALAVDLLRILGLVLENHVEDDIVRDTNNNKLSSILYLYDSSANAALHDKATGLTASYAVSASFTGNVTDLFKVIKA